MARVQIPRKRGSQRISRKYIQNPAKGLNCFVSDSLVDPQEASDLLNIAFDESGIVKKRDGFNSYGPTLTNPQGLLSYYTESAKNLIVVDGGQPKIYANSIWNNITGVTLDSSRPYITATQANNLTFLWDGVNGGVQYDGSTTSRPGTMPKGKFSIYWNGLHIVSGVPGQPSRVYFSAGGKPAVFTTSTTDPSKPSGTAVGDGWPDNSTDVPGATSFSTVSSAFTIDFGKNDGFAVTGVAIFQENVVVFKENAIYQLSFNGSSTATNASVTVITKSIGCVSHRTIAYVENDIYFLSRKGVFTLGNEQNYYTAIRTNELSARIRPLIKRIKPQSYEKCNAVYYNDQYLLAVPLDGTTVNRILGYDRRYQAWTIWDTIAPRSMINFFDDSNEQRFFFIPDTTSTTVKEVIRGQYNDDGKAISAYWVSGALDAGAIDITKRFVDLGILLRQLTGVFTVNVYLDDSKLLKQSSISSTAELAGYGADELGNSWVGGATATVGQPILPNDPWRIVIKRNSRTVKFRIENNRLDESFGFLGYVLAYYSYGYYRFDSAHKLY